MPVTLLDVVLLVVMLVSGLLAMIRGFMREILSIAAWVVAALLTVYAYPRLLPTAKSYFDSDIVAAGLTIVGVFLIVLLVVSVITVRVSDMILDSRVGALDRTLGFLFGLGRGLIIVVIAFIFFDWLVNEPRQPDWVRNAKSVVVLKSTGEWLKSLLPDDPESLYQQYKNRRNEPQEPPDGEPERPANEPRQGGLAPPAIERYARAERAGPPAGRSEAEPA